ncbi:MAG: Bpu10I family restriction endonuclease [Saprospiraceae bacterium]|nr:Bpu10I family restriction endonuclease [Saprospiraceae bacterium]
MATRNHYNHVIFFKSKSSTDKEVKFIYESYLKFIKNISTFQITDDKSISKFVSEFNSYRESVLYTIENRKNSGQENLRSSMLEELFCHLFSDLIGELLPSLPSNLLLGKANSYVDLTFSPSSFREIFIKPNPYIHSKDQDFVIGVNLELKIKADGANEIKEDIIVPVLAIECKTYIERNMLDSCSGTARRLKSAMPYCLYIVASEYMKLKMSNLN